MESWILSMNDLEVSRLADARRQTWSALYHIADYIQVGMSESEAIQIAQTTLREMGVKKFWHKCHVRFGRSTVSGYSDPYLDEVLRVDDIFLVDIGPVWGGMEGDAGATFIVGHNADMIRCQQAVKTIFESVESHWRENAVSGKKLYAFAEDEAKKHGYILAPSYVRGHRLSEFPHSFHSELDVGDLDISPLPRQWVLEIHICDPEMKFGAFYEDLLQ
ncbi:MAG: aminopeptidase P family protein [Proteobacteria bacterium]|nr:MAG: aminopeptidase P family protein [Pseudomonadota bacterium]